MVSILALWLPIVVAAVLVFLASSVIHMFLGYHKTDYGPLPQEDAILEALAPHQIPPGEYAMPFCPDPATMKTEAYQAKAQRGPVAIMTVMPPSYVTGMGAQLIKWFAYCVLVSVFAAYIAGRALGPGVDYLQAYRFAGATAFIAYTVGGWQRSVWYGQKLSTTIKNTIDGLIYGLLTGGVFGWLWPS